MSTTSLGTEDSERSERAENLPLTKRERDEEQRSLRDYQDEGATLIKEAMDRLVAPNRILHIELPRVGEVEAWLNGWYRDALVLHARAYGLHSAFVLGQVTPQQAAQGADELVHWAVQVFRPRSQVIPMPPLVEYRPLNITLSHYEIVARKLAWDLGRLYLDYQQQFNGVI